ncbi:MAG: peptidylprolyl isomerase, partial [Gemmatimonadetes bacterium]|nr:peptidylprolyl isomerase [Gemmatimonadota bacterium]
AIIRLSDADVATIARLLRLEDRREFDDSTLRAALRAPTPEVRRRAALAAGRIGDRAATPLLLAALADTAPSVRAGAAFALGLLRDTSAAVADSLAALARRTPADHADPAAQALWSLGRVATPRARDAVAAWLRDAAAPAADGQPPSRPRRAPHAAARPSVGAPDALGEALLALWKFPRTPALAGLARPYAAAPDPEVRWRAVYALARLRDPAATPVLLSALRDSTALVRALAARGLRAATVDSAGARAAASAALLRALRDPSPHVRIEAARALATYASPDLAAPLAALLEDADRNVATAAAEALGALGAPAAAPALDRTVAADSLPLSLRAAALAALVRVAPERGIARAPTWAAAADWRTRFYAAGALARGRWALAGATARALAADRDPRVAAAGIDAIADLAGDTIRALRAFYLEALASPDPIVRAAAVRAFGRTADPAEFALALDVYDRARRDTLDDAAVAAVEVLGALRARGAPVERSFFLRFPRSPDPVVRRVVFEKLGPGWGAPGPIETGRDLAFYEDVVRRLVAPELAGGAAPRVRIRTVGDSVTVRLAGADAPLTTENFLRLARRGYFDGGRWHRVVPGFVAQDGDPRGDGNGGPGWSIRDEINPLRYRRGTVGMALSGPDTGGSQFFVTHAPQPHLDGGYTVFGQVVEGMDVIDRIVQDDPITAVEVLP